MTTASVHLAAKPSHIGLRDRCRELGLPVWRYSGQGHILSAPTEDGIVGQWLRSPSIERLVERQVRKWIAADLDQEQAAELFPGCTVVPLSESHRRRRRALSAVILLGPEALDAEQFAQACQAAMLDRQAVRTALSPLARFSPDAAAATATLLGWMHQDLITAGNSQRDLAVFSRQLAESYEEISLLYRLGQSMNQLEAPIRFVRLACEDLHAVLNFGWIGACFLDSCPQARSLQNELVVSGDAPCDGESLRAHAQRITRELGTSEKAIIEGAAAGPLLGGGTQLLVSTVVIHGVVVGAIFAGAKKGDDRLASSSDQKLLGAAVGSLAVLLENAGLYDDQQSMFLGTLEALTTSIDAKDPYTCGHSERVAYLAASLATAVGLPKDFCDRIRISGLVHDVGKIGVPEAVLSKPGRLTDEEFALIKKHPEIGHQILRDIPLMDDVLPGVLYHHERFDGKGYPHQKRGEDIPLMARIIGLVDAFDAMSSNRTYRAAMNREKVLAEISKGAGTQFDPALAEVFLRMDLTEYDEIVARHHKLALAGDDRFGRQGFATPAPPSPAHPAREAA